MPRIHLQLLDSYIPAIYHAPWRADNSALSSDDKEQSSINITEDEAKTLEAMEKVADRYNTLVAELFLKMEKKGR